MIRRVIRCVMGITAVAWCAGCATFGGPFHRSGPSWSDALVGAQARAAKGDFDGADSALAAYATSHPGSNEALETTFWRALFKLDPSNRSASPTQAVASLDGYLSDPRPKQHGSEALTLRRAGAQLEGLNKMAANASSQAANATNAATNAKAAAADAKDAAKAADAAASAAVDAKDTEIKRLKDELAKANAELDRIKKRLSQPPSR